MYVSRQRVRLFTIMPSLSERAPAPCFQAVLKEGHSSRMVVKLSFYRPSRSNHLTIKQLLGEAPILQSFQVMPQPDACVVVTAVQPPAAAPEPPKRIASIKFAGAFVQKSGPLIISITIACSAASC